MDIYSVRVHSHGLLSSIAISNWVFFLTKAMIFSHSFPLRSFVLLAIHSIRNTGNENSLLLTNNLDINDIAKTSFSSTQSCPTEQKFIESFNLSYTVKTNAWSMREKSLNNSCHNLHSWNYRWYKKLLEIFRILQKSVIICAYQLFYRIESNFPVFIFTVDVWPGSSGTQKPPFLL